MLDDNRSVAVRAILGTAALASVPHAEVDRGHMERCVKSLLALDVPVQDIADAVDWINSKVAKAVDAIEAKK